MKSIKQKGDYRQMTQKSNPLFMKAFGVLICIICIISTSHGQNNVKALPDDTLATDIDRQFMRKAYEIAKSSASHGNHPFGALLVDEGKIVAEFENEVTTSGDITKHAETGLIGLASRKISRKILSESTIYTSTEPCIMCSGAIYWAGIKKIVFGTSESQMDIQINAQSRNRRISSKEVFQKIKPEMEIIGPVLEEEGLLFMQHFGLNLENEPISDSERKIRKSM
jgi:tRNA(Arg) A34 adenosine deaminase TadA